MTEETNYQTELDYADIFKKIKDDQPKRSNNIALGMLDRMVQFMYSDKVEKDEHGNVKDFRLDQGQAKDLSKNLMQYLTGEVMQQLTGQTYDPNSGGDELMIKNVVQQFTGLSENTLTDFVKDKELTMEAMGQISGSPGQSWAGSEKEYWAQTFDKDLKDEQGRVGLENYLNEKFGDVGIKTNIGEYKTGKEVMADIETLATKGVGQPDKYVAANPQKYSLIGETA
ncbi:hypothetical protein HOK51_00655 [Candidatus Woesearchaeota archaeon]|jgi:hypothetical protein|nr:hypothetical protein [Candidatus Woesearchaeota archaeon]MBT6518324.1 hypothetical protein [Candidatus Woesearchaeota archaeon]MBT7366621.1 hypothetical protein [Candidatus Woesearchaeota archaeon]